MRELLIGLGIYFIVFWIIVLIFWFEESGED